MCRDEAKNSKAKAINCFFFSICFCRIGIHNYLLWDIAQQNLLLIRTKCDLLQGDWFAAKIIRMIRKWYVHY